MLADSAAGLVAAYVHIPFCRRICPYCDFAVQAGGDIDRYVSALVAEIDREEPFSRPLDSIYVGGGTPTSLPSVHLERVLAALQDRLGTSGAAEISIEANPEDCSSDALRSLRSIGFNRVSLGAQSLDARTLGALGRAHDPEEARRAIDSARDHFESVNVDLIFGTPGEDLAAWQESVESVIAAGVDHLSIYALTVEPGTPLSRSVASGDPAPDPDLQADAYELATALAGEAGLVRYETSNLAKPGHACTYNLITWAQGEYAAFGNGAHRHRNGVRSWNVRRVDRFVERVEAGESPVNGKEALDPWGSEVERVMLGLRRAAGVVAGRAGNALVTSGWGRALAAAGVVSLVGGRLVVDRPLLGDEVSRALLALTEADC